MTAFLTVDDLRAHDASPDLRGFLRGLRRGAGAARPVLSARWLADADGRLVCRWLADDPAPDRPPQ